MLITILMMVSIIVLLILYNFHSRLNVIFVTAVTGFCIIIFSLSLYIMKTSYYNGILAIELKIYSFMRRININISSIKTLTVIGYIMVFMSEIFISLEMKSLNKKCMILVMTISAALGLGFLFINLPVISEVIYVRASASGTYDEVMKIDKILQFINYMIILYFMLISIPAIIISIKRTRMIFKKRQNTFIMVSFMFMNILIFSFSIATRIKNLLGVFMLNMFNTPIDSSNMSDMILYLTLIVVLLVISVCIIKLDIFNTIDFFRRRVMNKKMKFLIMDLKYIFHDFKNIMMTIIALKSAAEENYGTEEGRCALKKIETTAYDYADKVGELLDFYKKEKIFFKEVDLVMCLKSTIAKINQVSKIPVHIVNFPENSVIRGDSYQIQSLFYNLLKNSIEAIEKKGNEDGKIEVSFIEEEKWICLDFKDNGIGISKSELKRIWIPFISNKNTFLNWGIGLSHAKKIMDAHLGHIDIKSKKGEFAQIQTAFSRLSG